jgi:hypothetical protein
MCKVRLSIGFAIPPQTKTSEHGVREVAIKLHAAEQSEKKHEATGAKEKANRSREEKTATYSLGRSPRLGGGELNRVLACLLLSRPRKLSFLQVAILYE